MGGDAVIHVGDESRKVLWTNQNEASWQTGVSASTREGGEFVAGPPPPWRKKSLKSRSSDDMACRGQGLPKLGTGGRTATNSRVHDLTAGETGALFSEQTGPALSWKESCCWFRRTNRARVQTAAKRAELCGNHSRVIAEGKGTH